MKLSVFLEDELSISPGSVKLSIKSQLEKYREKYDALLKKNKRFHVDTYKVMPSKKVLVWIKVPSQSLDKFYYDVLLELDPADNAKSFEDCEIKFFSNSPSFVYGGYAYIFYHLDSDPTSTGQKGMMVDMYKMKIPRDNLLIPGSARKLGEEAVTEEPVVRNRLGIPMPDFSVYSAIFYLLDEMNYRVVMNTRNYRTTTQIITSVKSFNQLMIERKQEERREKAAKERKQKSEQKTVDKLVRMHSAGTATRVQSAKSPTRAKTSASAKSTKSNRGRSGGVNKIG